MSYVKLVLALVVMAVILYLAILNGGQTVTLRWSPAEGGSLENVPTSLALFAAFLLGVVMVALMGVFRELKVYAEVVRLRKENRRLRSELDELRAPEEEAEPYPYEDRPDGGSPLP